MDHTFTSNGAHQIMNQHDRLKLCRLCFRSAVQWAALLRVASCRRPSLARSPCMLQLVICADSRLSITVSSDEHRSVGFEKGKEHPRRQVEVLEGAKLQ